MSFFRHLLVDLIIHSHMPPQQGAFSRLDFHVTPRWEKYLLASGVSSNCLSILEAALNVLVLSEIIMDGMPRQAEKRLKLLMKAVVVKSMTKSRWTALVEEHVYKHNHTFNVPVLVPLEVLTNRGPAKSTPVVWNGRVCLTRCSGRRGEGLGRQSVIVNVIVNDCDESVIGNP